MEESGSKYYSTEKADLNEHGTKVRFKASDWIMSLKAGKEKPE